MPESSQSLCHEKTFSDVFNEYAKTLFNYLYYQCGDEAQAEDLTQDAFLKLWQNCSEVKLSTAKGYVFKIAKNKMLNSFEHQKVKLKFQRRVPKDRTDESPEFLLEHKEFSVQLEAAISELSEKQRVAFLLSRIDKKTYKEIAEILGISKQAVEKRIYNALDSLRKVNKNIK